MRRLLMALVFAMLFASTLEPAAAQPTSVGPITTQDVPTPLVGGGADGYTLATAKLFWFNGIPACPPGATELQAQYTQTINRIASYGSPTRTLYSQGESCSGGKINSNIAADASYMYWLGSNGTATGLIRLSTNANPSDTPELVNALVGPYGEIADGGDKTLYYSRNYSNNTSEIGYVLKSNNQRVALTLFNGSASNLSTDGSYVYYLHSSILSRITISNAALIDLTSGVTGYYAEGRTTLCLINPARCIITNTVYIAKGASVITYNNLTSALNTTPVYTSDDTNARIFALTTTGVFGNLFAFETRTTGCGQFICPSTNILVRTVRSGSGAKDAIYTTDGTNIVRNLTNDGTYLFWNENSTIQRLPGNAAALPNINMRIFAPSSIGNGIEVTQGIQSLDNTVLLVQNRRTFVRVYAKSDSVPVGGVGAQLVGTVGSATLGVLAPVNSVGTKLTVRGTPDRNDLNQSFLFELPWSWTTSGVVRLTATINPYKVPLEPNYTDDSASINLTFKPSPKLSVDFFRLNYRVGAISYSSRIDKDVLQTYSWLMRAYPIGGAIGQNFKPRLWDVDGGTKLGSWVTQSSGDCDKVQNDQKDRALCASYYTNGWLKYYRDHGWVPNISDFYYGFISDGAGFPRGQALYNQTSVGPAGSGTFGWDLDGSYADWYAGHEIGHSLGRAHPNAGSDNPATNNVSENCGHSRSDPGFPYGNLTTARAPIGPPSGSIEGFDVGDSAFGIARAIYPSSIWNDVMSYCSNQWLSDYTYTAMYNYMSANPSSATMATRSQIMANGDFLSIAGSIKADTSSATITFANRLSNAASQPPLTPGAYSLRLIGATNNTLADYSFTPSQEPESGNLGFSLVVNFVAGTRTIQVVKTGGSVIASLPVSANPPTISGVALQAAPNPVSGIVTLGWNASDADGDPLTFDIFYSRDGGATYQPVQMGATGNSTQIDTAMLGGSGTATLRVVASDGVNSAEASSSAFVMANKPPQPYILSPSATTHIHYGQLVNFNGVAFDSQDNLIDASGLVWKDAKGTVLGTGPLISADALPVGSNLITLTATNSVGVLASATVTVIVDDDLALPSATLTAGPGQIGWQVGAGETAAQTAQISIGNSGSGTLNWTATSDKPWLTLSAASGSVASDGEATTLTLTADPSSLAANSPNTATVTLTKPEDSSGPAQTITIPVSLNVGNVWSIYTPVATPARSGTVYLPLTVR